MIFATNATASRSPGLQVQHTVIRPLENVGTLDWIKISECNIVQQGSARTNQKGLARLEKVLPFWFGHLRLETIALSDKNEMPSKN